MSSPAFIYHPDCLKHDTGPVHVERPERVISVVKHLKQLPLWKKMLHIQPDPVELNWLHQVHPVTYVESIRQRCLKGESVLDGGDTHVCRLSYNIALLAAGAAIRAVDLVVSGKVHSAFSCMRPPGHHAETAKVMGFCLFNNAAIAVRYAQKQYGIERIAIVDWDVHHGNGTQEIFYEDPTVLYISTHQFPLWPGTGSATETGSGKGIGFTLNCPMRPGSGEMDYLEMFHSKIIPELHKFQPQLLIISAGFDAHKDDPLAQIELTEQSFEKFTALLMEIANKYCGGKIVSLLEGGYNLAALAKCMEAHLGQLAQN